MKKKKINKKQRRMRRFILAGFFIVFSAILFINNLTQLLSNWFILTSFQINLISWIGLIGSVIYTIWKVTGGEL